MQLQRRFLVLCAVLVFLLPVGAQQAGPANPFSHLLTMQMNWDALKSDDNAKPSLPLRFVPYNEYMRDGKTFKSYYVYASGLPSDQRYTLVGWKIWRDARQPAMHLVQSDMFINARGVVMRRKPTQQELNSDAPQIDSEARVDLTVTGSKGEPVRYAVHAENHGIVAMGRVIVSPIEAEDKGCHLQVILAVVGGEAVLVEGTGFSPESSIELTSEHYGKPQSANLKTDAGGRLETTVVLERTGQTQGTATISAKSNSCAPKVQFDWKLNP